ncbi:MAG TPA: tetratricopeptide repeat protein [Candidatus Kapabacteria bacterium]|jgi:tetratricopeptide (TPR) repeat protein/DNA-binding CsgD family transcriptional regulator|nr:tetratricopeptide repeat protein [Candidatus Kapabacteria bacterium]
MSDTIEELERRLALATRRADRIDLGVRLSAALLTRNSRAALDHAERAVGIARSRRADDEIARTLLQAANCHIAMAEYPRALELSTTALAHATESDEPALIGSAQSVIGEARAHMGAHAAARRAYDAALAIAIDAADRREEATLLNALAGLDARRARYVEALENCHRSLEIWESLGDARGINRVTNNMGVIYLEVNDLVRAHEQFTRGLEQAKALDDRRVDMIAHENLGSVLLRMRRFEEAREEYAVALAMGREHDAPGIVASCLSGIGISYSLEGDHERALPALIESVEIAARIGHPSQFSSLASIAEARAALGDVAEGIALLEQALDGVRAAGRRTMELDILGQLSDLCERAGDVDRALSLHKEASALREEVTGIAPQRGLVEIEMRAEIERAEREREEIRRRAASLAGEVRSRTEELGEKTIGLAEQEGLLDAVRREITGVAGLSSDAIAQRIDASADEGATFEEQFERLHGGFIRALSDRHPSLTPTELKVCALLKVDMGTKEIAAAMSSSVRTVETHRLRIRRKLSLPRDTSMASYLASL